MRQSRTRLTATLDIGASFDVFLEILTIGRERVQSVLVGVSNHCESRAFVGRESLSSLSDARGDSQAVSPVTSE